MRRKINIIANIDWITVTLYIVMLFLGWINIYAAEYAPQYSSIFDLSQEYGKQLLWIFGSMILGFMILLIDSKFFAFFAYPLYGVIMLLLMGVLIFGTEIHGAQSWFTIGSFRVQPAEFAKFATALALSKYLSRSTVHLSDFRSLVTAILILSFPALLIMLQPDMGTALVFFSLILVLYREGLPYGIVLMLLLIPLLFIATLVLEDLVLLSVLVGLAVLIYTFFEKRLKSLFEIVAVLAFIFGGIWLLNTISEWGLSLFNIAVISVSSAAIIFLIMSVINRSRVIFLIVVFFIGSFVFVQSADYVFQNVLKPHQQERINILLGMKKDPQGVGYNVNQSKIAIGSGGLTGKGFLQGTHTKFDFVPEQSTDFIFCTIGEEWGFVGSTVIIALFVILFVRLVRMAERQRSVFARIYGYSVLSILFFHFIVNIGMTVGLTPVIGIPLPFFSYGGSSLIGFTLLLAIMINLDTRRSVLMA